MLFLDILMALYLSVQPMSDPGRHTLTQTPPKQNTTQAPQPPKKPPEKRPEDTTWSDLKARTWR